MPKLKEILPQEAGKAVINFVIVTPPAAYRDHNVINLPFYREAEFYPLQGGNQFLFFMPINNWRKGLWFGGTDDKRIFLVELKQDMYKIFREDGEEMFYAYLKPSYIRELERNLKISSKRQGDIYAAPLEKSWEEIKDDTVIFTKGKAKKPAKQLSIFGTHHKLTGDYIVLDSNQLIAEGRIESPGHKPLILEGLHAIAQTEALKDSGEADDH
ncbi:hypothetical protein ACFLZS_01560 [Patescibacteria group bacterium]